MPAAPMGLGLRVLFGKVAALGLVIISAALYIQEETTLYARAWLRVSL